MFASFNLCRLPARALRLPRSFARDERGGVAVTFGLILFALCLFVGAAVDFARWTNAHNQTSGAIDAAVLAGGRALLVSNSPEEAQAAAQTYFHENLDGRSDILDNEVVFEVLENNSAFAGTSTSYIRPAFLSFAGLKRLPLTVYSRAVLPRQPLDISVMLDVTGSMGMPASKIADLKIAAADLVNIMLPANQTNDLVRIALVPFAEGVRLPASMNQLARGTPGPAIPRSVRNWYGTTTYRYEATECVVERKGANRYTDTAPGPGNYVMTLFNTDYSIYRAGVCGVKQASELMPLTNNRANLLSRIQGLELSGGTAGQLGTAWAWYTLSPNWNALWPAESKATPYDGDTKKVAILMTDGEYNVQYDTDGIQSDMPGAGSPANTISRTQARTLCTNMKDSGIEIYTVGFALGNDQTAIETMNLCASSPAQAYIANNGDQLRESFRDIALRISNLYLTN